MRREVLTLATEASLCQPGLPGHIILIDQVWLHRVTVAPCSPLTRWLHTGQFHGGRVDVYDIPAGWVPSVKVCETVSGQAGKGATYVGVQEVLAAWKRR